MEIRIETPHDFSYRRTVLSHGWYQLPPFELDLPAWTLRRTLDLPEGAPVSVRIAEGRGCVVLSLARKVNEQAAARIARDVRRVLRLDDDLSDFYRAASSDVDFGWIEREGAGRLLRSPTVYEDLVKTICTTNCSWAATVKMVTAIVAHLGGEAADGRRNFPTPRAMAEAPFEFYSDVARAGYRAPYLKELAERVAAGELDVEGWLTSELPTPLLQRKMKQVKGVGDYAAENMLKLLGRYDCLALDSWVRAKFARVRGAGRATADAEIARRYARFAEWRGLALWCDMTRDWLAEESVRAS